MQEHKLIVSGMICGLLKVAEEIKTLAADEFQMAPRRTGTKIWEFLRLCCHNYGEHRALMKQYKNVCFLFTVQSVSKTEFNEKFISETGVTFAFC